MLNILVYCVLAYYSTTVLLSEKSWDIGDGLEMFCVLVTAVLVLLPTGATSELEPTEFRTHRYGEICIRKKAIYVTDLRHCNIVTFTNSGAFVTVGQI